MQPNEVPAAGVPEAASPFPPAFRWETSSEAPTQVMRAVGRDTAGGDPAQAIQGIRSSPSYQQQPNDVRDLFQPIGPPPDQAPHQAPDETSTAPTDSSAPPWADSDQPPIAEQQSAWLRLGPEVFEAPSTRSPSKQVIGIAVLAAVVLGLVVATVMYFVTSGPDRPGSEQIAAPAPTAAPRDLPAPPAPLPAPADTEQALTDPPGQTRGGGGLFDLPQLKTTNLLPRPIQDVLQAGGMTEGVLKTTTVGGNTIGMFALTMPDQQAATTVAQTIATAQRDGGLKADDNRALRGVAVMGSAPGSSTTVYRAVYVLYNRAIFFEVFGPDRDDVLATFDFLLHQQVVHAPPTVRVGR